MNSRKLNAGRGRQNPFLRHSFTSPIVLKSFEFSGKPRSVEHTALVSNAHSRQVADAMAEGVRLQFSLRHFVAHPLRLGEAAQICHSLASPVSFSHAGA